MGRQIRALCGYPNLGTNRVHIRNKPKTGEETLLRDRQDRHERYSALPWSVLVDPSLEPIDWGVFACLASRAFKADTIQMGSRWIAECLGVTKGRVQAGVSRLVSSGHLEIQVVAKGSRPAIYRLTSPVFSQRQRVHVSDRRGSRDTTRYDIERKRELERKLKTA